MKPGDLIRKKNMHLRSPLRLDAGLIVETGVYAGRKDIKVFWPELGDVCIESSKWFEVISESR